MRNIATGYGISANELYTRFKPECLKTKTSTLPTKNKKKFAARVLMYTLKLIILDIIHNNVTFKIPVNTEAYIEMKGYSGDAFGVARRNGAFEDVDFLKSNFTGYQLEFRYKIKAGWRTKSIKVSKHIKQMITDKTNEGEKFG